MKNKFTIAFIVSAAAAAAFTVYVINRNKSKKMLAKVSDEGYETAADVLFPNQRNSGKLHYGPVIPL